MLAYIIRRIVYGAAVLLGTSIITFTIAFVIPADPAVAMAGAKADPQTLAAIRHQLGLDQPVYIQYAHYLDRALHGDLGRSYIRRASVTRIILSRFPATAILALCAMGLSLLLGIPMGMVAAAWRGRAADNLLLLSSLALISIPVFWLGTMLLIAGGLYLVPRALSCRPSPLRWGRPVTIRGSCTPTWLKRWSRITFAPLAARGSRRPRSS
jgi:peptide/nickel transport system permease protein